MRDLRHLINKNREDRLFFRELRGISNAMDKQADLRSLRHLYGLHRSHNLWIVCAFYMTIFLRTRRRLRLMKRR